MDQSTIENPRDLARFQAWSHKGPYLSMLPLIDYVHAVGYEDLVQEHVRVAEIMLVDSHDDFKSILSGGLQGKRSARNQVDCLLVADVGIGLVLVASDNLAHLLWRQIGMDPLAEFEGEGFDGGNHGGVGNALLMASYSALIGMANSSHVSFTPLISPNGESPSIQ